MGASDQYLHFQINFNSYDANINVVLAMVNGGNICFYF